MDTRAEEWQGRRMATPLLVTISFSHFCEKARWVLDHAGIAYRESGHLPMFHVPAVRRAGGRHSTPTLLTDEGVLGDSSDIVAWADRQRPEAGLFGKSAAERAEIARLEDRFDEALGPHARRWAYHHLLADRAASLRMFDAQTATPAFERRVMRVIFPAVRAIMRRGMKIDAERAERSRRKVDEVLDEIAAKLADGRRYLVGDAPTVADLTFAALAIPAVLPDHPRVVLPPFEALPPEAAAQIRAWRAHPAGACALRMVSEHRQRMPVSAAAA
jgi:glutathione S-transferase